MSKRAEEVGGWIAAEMFRLSYYSQDVQAKKVSEILATLPEFAERKWIACSERMPERGALVWFMPTLNEYPMQQGVYYPQDWQGTANGLSDTWNDSGVTHWMPRVVPAPPVVESELVIGLRKDGSK